jgi:hypothetical protein
MVPKLTIHSIAAVKCRLWSQQQRCCEGDRKMKIEAYMMIGFHTLVVMQRCELGYRIATFGVTPQCEGTDVEKLLKASWTEFKRCQYATDEVRAVEAFGNVVASELEDERASLQSLAEQARYHSQHIATMVA